MSTRGWTSSPGFWAATISATRPVILPFVGKQRQEFTTSLTVELEGDFHMHRILKTTVRAIGISVTLLGIAAAQDRFDMKVRNDFFAGFAGNQQALDRAMNFCEKALAANPQNAEAMVWHGAGALYQSGQFFQAGDRAKGGEFWQRALAEMDAAVAIAPDRVSVRIPRGAALLTASRNLASPEMARPLIEKAVSDYKRSLEIQKDRLDSLGTHARGELLIGLADGYARLGKDDQAASYFERIRAALPGTPYAASAEKWLQTKTLGPHEAGCLGCHVAK
jgi:tetratricopeptide (TPR) repeat protein